MKIRRKIKILLLFFTFIIFALLFNFNESQASEKKTITFKDANLYQAIKNKVSSISSTNDNDLSITIGTTELENVNYLTLENYNIKDLSGIDGFYNLINLYLDGNQLTDINVLGNLKQLSFLSLNRNQISNLTPIENLQNLTYISATFNKIKDISKLGNLKNLEYLYLDYNNEINLNDIEKINCKNISCSQNIEIEIDQEIGENKEIDFPELLKKAFDKNSKLYVKNAQISNYSEFVEIDYENQKIIIKPTNYNGYNTTISISGSPDSYGLKGSSINININYYSTEVNEIKNLIPNEMNLDIPEIEYRKSGEKILSNIKELLNSRGIKCEIVDNVYNSLTFNINDKKIQIDVYENMLYLGKDYFNTASIRFYINDMYSSYGKDIKITYNNHNKYNKSDENAVKNLKLNEAKYVIIDYEEAKKLDDLYSYFDCLAKYYQNQINDKTIKIFADSGAGDYFIFDNGFDGLSLGIFKNDVLYDIKQVKTIGFICQINIPENIKDTENDYINYALPIIKEYYKNFEYEGYEKIKLEKSTENIGIDDLYTIKIGENNTGRVILKKAETPKSTVTSDTKGVVYRTQVQDIGWQVWKQNGETAGTSGKSKRLESIELKLQNTGISGGITYRTHVQNIGWQDWKSNGEMSGTIYQGLRLEAIEIKLTGEMANKYDIYYRVHAQEFGWLDWAKNGESAGTSGYGYRLEAIEIKLVTRGSQAPGNTSKAFKSAPPIVAYTTHVQDIGWQTEVKNKATAGTLGERKRLEGIKIRLLNTSNVGIQYQTHIQDIGWQDWKSNGDMSGTSGQGKRLEAIRIKLTGKLANNYDVYYRVHAQEFGWLDWAKNGESAGTEGYGYRLEAIEIILVNKGEKAPGSTNNTFKKRNNI